jgi:hypothetical protein
MGGPHHRMNAEDDDNRIFSKDRWPIPLHDTRFLQVNANNGSIYFGSTYPTLLIQTHATEFDISRCNAEVLHIHEPVIIQTLIQ